MAPQEVEQTPTWHDGAALHLATWYGGALARKRSAEWNEIGEEEFDVRGRLEEEEECISAG